MHLLTPFQMLAIVAATSASLALAQPYPARPLRFIVPFVPGGGLDVTARLLAPGMAQSLGKQVVIDNRPGAGGAIALEMAARATPDGHTFIMVSASHVILAAMGATGGTDIFRDLAPVTEVIATPYALVTWPGLSLRSVKELIAYAKANPNKLSYGTSGNGTLQHLAMELFLQAQNLQAQAVPYKGVGATLPDLFAGRTQIYMSSLSSLTQHIRAKSLTPLAVTTRERNAALPDLPTMIESGIADFDVTQWQGVLVTTGTPAAITTRLQRDIANAARAPIVAAHFASDGSTTVAGTPAAFQIALAAERKRWSSVVKRAGLKAD